MGAVLALLLPAIPSLVNLAETLFAKKPKSGPDKLNAVTQTLQVLLTQLKSAGLISTDSLMPSAEGLHGAIEAVLANQKATGQLGQPIPSGSVYIVQGIVTPLNVALPKAA